MSVEVIHFNPRRPVLRGRIGRRIPIRRPLNNFGDLLGPLLVDAIRNSSPRSSGDNVRRRLLTIGSIMSLSLPGDTIWGTGVNGKSLGTGGAPNLDVRAVRGPLSRARLRELGTDVPEIYGDPGLLWSVFWPRESYTHGLETYEITIVPNFHDWPRYKNDARAVSPIGDVHEIIRRIALSRFVTGSSLHGVVVAESFGIPARVMSSNTEPDFKYVDYYQGTGRTEFNPARSVNDAIAMGGERPPDWDAQQLLDAFPSDLWQVPSA